MDVLSKANVSGSLEYWGRCEKGRAVPDYPHLSIPVRNAGTALETLREMFADDPNMQVTEEADGTIRMVETDVPRDLLDLSISHISFDGGIRKTRTPPDGPERSEPWVVDDPNDALWFIFSAPEVRAFIESQNIRPPYELRVLSGFTGSARPHIAGNLNDLTLLQALDHVLKIFPGFWVYENCPSQKKGRMVSITFRFDAVGWAAGARRQQPVTSDVRPYN